MKIKCKKEDLKKGFHIVENVVSSSTIKPVLQNVKIVAEKDTIELSTTDLEVSISYVINHVEVIEPGVVVCSETKIASIIKEWTDDSIEINEDNKVCLITSERSYFKILCAEPDDFPAIPKFIDDTYVEIDKRVLADMIKKTLFIIQADRLGSESNGLYFEISEDKAKMVSNDGRRLAEVKKKINNPENLEKSCIIPLKGATQILKILSEQTTSMDDKGSDIVKVRIEEKRILIKTINSTFCSQLIEGIYPEYEEVIPTGLSNKVNLERHVFTTAVRRGAIMTSEDYKLLRFKFFDGILEMKCASPDIGESKVEIPIEYSGEMLEIGLNPDFILDFIKTVDEEKVVFEMEDVETAGVFKVGGGCTYVIMPMELSVSEE